MSRLTSALTRLGARGRAARREARLRWYGRRILLALGVLALLTPLAVETALAQLPSLTFPLVRSTAVTNANCLPQASAQATVRSVGPVELLDLTVTGLPPNKEFDVFVIQVPNAPFGVSWYQGDIETDAQGRGSQRYIGRFNIETFAVAPGSGPAPIVHTAPPYLFTVC